MNILKHLIRRILQILLSIIIGVACLIIYVVTFEPNTKKRATRRKIRRIRILTKFKLYMYKWFKPLFDFLHYEYLKKLYNKFYFLIEK